MTTLAQILRQAYDEAPGRTAIQLLQDQRNQTITYRDLLAGAAGFANAFQRAGARPGDPVVIILQHGAELIYSFCGAILHGAIPSIMPFLTEKLSPEHYRRGLESLIAITRPTLIVTYSEFEAEVRAAVGLDSSVRGVLLSSAVSPAAAIDFAALPGLACAEDDITLLQHSSGTTGLQKGVALSHRAVLRQVNAYAEAIRLSPADVIVSWLPLYHDMGLIAGFVMPILSRVPLVLMSPFEWVRAPQKLMRAASGHRATLCWLPNFAYNFCAQKIRDRDLEGVDLSNMRAFVNCSEPVRWRSHQVFVERFARYGLRAEALTTCYAMAENVFAVTQAGMDGPVTVDEVDQRALLIDRVARPASGGGETLKMLSCGRPIANTRVRVLDDQRRDLPDRHVGEIALQSDCMLTGYYNREDATAQAFHDGWYLTGDLGYLAEGEVYVTGRKKDLIIVGGKNVYPHDLEMLAGEAPGVHPGRVVAFGVFNEAAGTEDVALVAEVDAEGAPERQKIAEEIRRRVNHGSDVVVRYVRVVGPGWLLKTSSGKIARGANRDKFLAERDAPT